MASGGQNAFDTADQHRALTGISTLI